MEIKLKGKYKMNIFISGFPRAGTTMLCLMMNYFEDCDVYSDAERHPSDFAILESNKKHIVLKQPFGVLEFTPLYDYKSLNSDYGCKIVSLVRHPFDVGTSIHANDRSIYWVPIDMIIRNCEEYLNNQDNTDVLFVRYEDLMRDTAKELDRVSEFLGCSHNYGFWDFYKHPHAALSKNNSLNEPRKIDTNSIGRWKEEEHAIRVMELKASELVEYIEKLGYTYE